MPKIKSSADLRNNYNEISTFCHNYPEPVFITKNGKGDLAVMSIEAYEDLTSRFELYSQIKEGMDDVLKLWQISGVVEHDELSASYHINCRA